MTVQQRFDTHDIFNQSPPYEDVDLFTSDRALQDAVRQTARVRKRPRYRSSGAAGARPRCSMRRGSPTRTPRSCKTFDTKGFRRDAVEFHPGLSRASWPKA